MNNYRYITFEKLLLRKIKMNHNNSVEIITSYKIHFMLYKKIFINILTFQRL
jgi:hypothetical protein